MKESFSQMKVVPLDELDRLESIKDIVEKEKEAYGLMRDKETGEHYLHYAYFYNDYTHAGNEEYFHQLLPLDTNDVLAHLYGDELYTYPDQWQHSYLRSGPDGGLVWFTPEETSVIEENEKIGLELHQKLAEFKQQGNLDDTSVQKLMEEIDRFLKK